MRRGLGRRWAGGLDGGLGVLWGRSRVGRGRWEGDGCVIADAMDGVADAESGAWVSRVGGCCCERGLGWVHITSFSSASMNLTVYIHNLDYEKKVSHYNPESLTPPTKVPSTSRVPLQPEQNPPHGSASHKPLTPTNREKEPCTRYHPWLNPNQKQQQKPTSSSSSSSSSAPSQPPPQHPHHPHHRKPAQAPTSSKTPPSTSPSSPPGSPSSNPPGPPPEASSQTPQLRTPAPACTTRTACPPSGRRSRCRSQE